LLSEQVARAGAVASDVRRSCAPSSCAGSRPAAFRPAPVGVVWLEAMNPVYYSVLHVLAGFILVAFTFVGFAAPTAANKRRVMMFTGIASVVMLIAGFGLQAKLHVGFPGWLIVKLVCWLGLSAISGMAFKKPENAGKLSMIALLLVAIAVFCVYVRPF